MNFFDNENKIIEYFQMVKPSEVLFPSMTKEAESVFIKVHDRIQWKKWTDSSGKDAPPPDFFSDEFLLMMDVMRVDDHAFINEKGKIINPTNAKESRLRKELKQSGIYKNICDKNIFINAITDLPTERDHNYDFYLENFRRVVTEHIRKIKLYKINHPEHKVIFFVMDESSAYLRVEKKMTVAVGDRQEGTPHCYFMDKAFLEVFQNTCIDYLIWYCPYKIHITETGIIKFPKVTVYDISQKGLETINYDSSRMISTEV